MVLQRVQLGAEEHAARCHRLPVLQGHHVHLHALPGVLFAIMANLLAFFYIEKTPRLLN
jgi:hypothetical protein